MSTSPRSVYKPELSVWSDADAEIQIFDARLDSKVHGVGEVKENLDPGLYKVRVVRSGAIVERLIELSKDQTVNLRAEPAYSVAPIYPVYQYDSQDIEELAQKALSARGRLDDGEGSILFLAHRTAAELADPLTQVALARWASRSTAPKIGKPLEKQIGTEFWSARSAIAGPGPYELQLTTGLRQVVPVLPGWETRIFMRRASGEARFRGSLDGDRSRSGAAPFEVSIQMAQVGSQVVYHDHYESIEVARRALESERPIFGNARMIDQLLGGKWDNPLMGLTGAHLLLATLEWDQRQSNRLEKVLSEEDRAWALKSLPEVIKNLESLLGPYCRADLCALRVRSRPFRALGRGDPSIDAPPIYWSSWRVLRRGDEASPAIPRFVWSRIAKSRPVGPYFGWRPARVSLDREVDELLSGKREARGGDAPFLDVERNLFDPSEHLLDPDGVEDFARILGAPSRLVSDSLAKRALRQS